MKILKLTLVTTLLLTSLTKAQDINKIIVSNTECKDYTNQIENLKSKKVIFFDLDNTLFTTNNHRYGSDDWSTFIKKQIELNVKNEFITSMKNELFDSLTPINYTFLPVEPICVQLKDKLNEVSKNKQIIIGLTSRAMNISKITERNLNSAGYRFQERTYHDINKPNSLSFVNNIIYTEGKNKGIAIKEFLDNNKTDGQIYEVVYIDDTLSKIKDAQSKLVGTEYQNLVVYYHLQNQDTPKHYTNSEAKEFWENFLFHYLDKYNVKKEDVLK